MMASTLCQLAALALCGALLARDRLAAAPPLAILGGTIHTMNGPPLCDGVVLLADGKVQAVGPAGVVAIPVGATVLKAAVVTPGLIDAHCVIGLSGHLNQKQDQDQLDTSTAMQPELRAIDAYNPQERLIEWVRGFGVTTLH
ncbi:MAG: amidohydrolase, partial [Planctomycetes bacterium]|nr:amidohydrolase [Planctomycetota bacterium]